MTSSHCRLATIAGAVIFSVGCAATPPNTAEQLATTEQAIASAEGAQARENAPVLLNAATSNLKEAREAMEEYRYAEALRLLEKAEAEAKLAQAQSEAATTLEAVAELEESILLLKQQIEQNGGQS